MALPKPHAVPPAKHRPAAAKKTAHPAVPLTEVEIFATSSHKLIGFPDAAPLKRAASNDLDTARIKTLRDLLAASAAAAKALRDYAVAHGHAEAGTDKADLAVILAGMVKSGLMIARGPSFKGVTASPLTLSAAGEQFLYGQETQPGVSEKLHHPTAASGVTLGPGYDMLARLKSTIISDLTAIGIDRKIATTISEAAGSTGGDADDFVAKNEKLIKLTDAQQLTLLRKQFPKYVTLAKDGLFPSLTARLFDHEFDALVSFTYNRGHLKGTRLAIGIDTGNLANVNFSRLGPAHARIRAEWLMFTSGVYI